MSKVRVEGLRELDKALGELPRQTGKRVALKVLKNAGGPLADAGSANAPLGPTGNLRDSYGVGTKLTDRQGKLNRKESPVEVYIGPNDPAATQTEFGNSRQAPQPHLRPAWDAGKEKALQDIKDGLWSEIKKAADRLARKAARAAAKGK